MKRLKDGDIFAIQIQKGKYIFGRILINIKKHWAKSGIIKQDSPLIFFGGSLVIEMYKDLSNMSIFDYLLKREILIPSVYVDSYSFKSGTWQVVGYKKIDPTEVNFPETLIRSAKKVFFSCGELEIPIPLTLLEFEKIHIVPTLKPSTAIANICLYYLNMKHLITSKHVKLMNLKNSDLRFSEYRNYIYRLLDEDDKQSYYQISKKYGYNIVRFYK